MTNKYDNWTSTARHRKPRPAMWIVGRFIPKSIGTISEPLSIYSDSFENLYSPHNSDSSSDKIDTKYTTKIIKINLIKFSYDNFVFSQPFKQTNQQTDASTNNTSSPAIAVRGSKSDVITNKLYIYIYI